MLPKLINTFILKPLESVLVIGYLLFEEIIWDLFAKPLISYLKSLAILDRLKQTFLTMNRYLLVTFFLLIFVIAEYMGVLSLITIAQQQLLLGISIYALKIPIAAFTFWLFDLTKPQLMTFPWLKVTYETLLYWIDRIVQSNIYKTIKYKVMVIKQQLRELREALLLRNAFVKHMQSIYQSLKAALLRGFQQAK